MAYHTNIQLGKRYLVGKIAEAYLSIPSVKNLRVGWVR
jgi:hypothetical protein